MTEALEATRGTGDGPLSPLLSVEAAADYLGVSERTLERRRKSGQGAHRGDLRSASTLPPRRPGQASAEAATREVVTPVTPPRRRSSNPRRRELKEVPGGWSCQSPTHDKEDNSKTAQRARDSRGRAGPGCTSETAFHRGARSKPRTTHTLDADDADRGSARARSLARGAPGRTGRRTQPARPSRTSSPSIRTRANFRQRAPAKHERHLLDRHSRR